MGSDVSGGSDAPEGPGWWQASDGRFYPPTAEPGWREPPVGWRPPSAEPDQPLLSTRALRVLTVIGGGAALLVAVGVVGFVLGRGGDEVTVADGAPADGNHFALDISTCPTAGGEFAGGSIRNTTDDILGFRIELPFIDTDGAELSNDSTEVRDLRPNEAAQWSIGPAPQATVDCAGDQNKVSYITTE